MVGTYKSLRNIHCFWDISVRSIEVQPNNKSRYFYSTLSQDVIPSLVWKNSRNFSIEVPCLKQLWMYCKCMCIIKKIGGGEFMGQGEEKWLIILNSCWYWLQTCNNVLVLTNVDWFYCRNPYDIPRKNLIDQIARMRSNFLQKSFHRTKLVDDGKYQVFDINWILIG